MTNKLYKVTLRGMTYSSTSGAYGVSYVVAKDPDEAYRKVRAFLDEKGLGFRRERELDKIELLAEEKQYTDSPAILYL